MSKTRICWSAFAVALLIPLVTHGSPIHDHPDVVAFFKTASSSTEPLSSFTCDTCKVLFSLVRELFEKGLLWDDIVKLAIDVCEDMKIEDHAVCQGIVPLFRVRQSSVNITALYCCYCTDACVYYYWQLFIILHLPLCMSCTVYCIYMYVYIYPPRMKC